MFAAFALMGVLAAEAPGAPISWGRQVDVEFIVDGSGSMAGRVSGLPKIAWTKNGLKAILDALPPSLSGASLGLRVFGARSPKVRHDCQDTHLEVPLDGLNRSAIVERLGVVHPTGYTPLAASLEAAAGDFKGAGDRIVVIITDGVESCGGDPCATSDRLVKAGAFSKPYVMGFAVDEEDKKRLSCIGTYVDARSGEELEKLLRELVEKAVVAARIEVSATFDGKPLAASQLAVSVRQGARRESVAAGRAVRVPPGDYEVEVEQRLDPRCGAAVVPAHAAEGSVTRVVTAFGRGKVSFAGPELSRTTLQIWPSGELGKGSPLLAGTANQSARLCTGRYDFRFTHPTRGQVDVTAYEVKPGGTGAVAIPLR